MVTRGLSSSTASEAALLKDAARWRDDLARNIALRNPGLNSEEIALASQSVLMGILFLRIFEARSDSGCFKIQSILDADGIYSQLCDLLSGADNSCTRSNQNCKSRSNQNCKSRSNQNCKSKPCDGERFGVVPGLVVDDGPLKKVIGQVCLPGSYDFSAMPINVLGRVYEHLLGSEIFLPGGGKAGDGSRNGSRANARKTGGIYYTPDYMIDYIVGSALGRLLEGKNPTQAGEIKILDPACGCGSFLIRALKYLLDWHLRWYVENLAHGHESFSALKEGDEVEDGEGTSEKIRAIEPIAELPLTRSKDGRLKLTAYENVRILQNSIFGMDIDPNAVEIARRSLQLMLLEISGQGHDDAERLMDALNLCSNIKCGNALIGSGFSGFSGTLESPDARADPGREISKGIQAFNWSVEFPEAMKSGGFDVVIGNPPYVRQERLCQSEGLKNYLKGHYHVYHGGADLYSYFIERGFSLLRPGGILSYITANKWLRARYGLPLRRWMKALDIIEVIDFGDSAVFEKASAYPCILTISKLTISKDLPEPCFRAARVRCLDLASDSISLCDLGEHISGRTHRVERNCLNDRGWSLTDDATQALLSKIMSNGVSLGSYVGGKSNIHRGVLTGLNRAFIIDRSTREELIQEDSGSLELIKPVVSGKDIKRYSHIDVDRVEKFLIFAKQGTDIDGFPAVKRYLGKFREDLEPKARGDWAKSSRGRKPGDYRWHEIQDPTGYYRQFEVPKIILPDISLRGNFTLDHEGGCYCLNNAYIISSSDCYLLAILNSALITFFYKELCSTCRGDYLRFTLQYLEQLPIHIPAYSDPDDCARCSSLKNLASEMLVLHRHLARSSHEKERAEIQDRIESTDRKIDDLVYELYNLTEDEVELVKEGVQIELVREGV